MRDIHQKIEDEKQTLRAAFESIKDLDGIKNVSLRTKGPVEFDPRQGETRVPRCVEFKVLDESFETLNAISQVCDEFGLRVTKPEFKQPGFTFKHPNGSVRTYNQDVSYESFVRLRVDK